MNFDAGTWWLVATLVTAVIGVVASLIKRGIGNIFGRMGKYESAVEQCVHKADYDSDVQELKEDIKQIRQDYTPRADHAKDLDECRGDIKKIKEDYITKEDFYREQAKVDRKLDRIMDILLEMKGGSEK